MNPSRARFHILLAWTLATLGACSDSFGPADIAGAYALAVQDGKPLPVLLHSGPTMDVLLVSETLLFHADGTGRRSATMEERRAGGETVMVHSERTFTYDVVEGRIEVAMFCGPTELCSPPPHLVLYRSGQDLRSTATPGSLPTVYVRAPLVD